MSHSIDQNHSEFDGLLKWVGLIMLLAIVPHYIAQMGFADLAESASVVLFPLTMGPLSIMHCCMVVNSLGFTTHMAWMFALLLTLMWSGTVFALWRWKRELAIAIFLISVIISTTWISRQIF